MSDKIFTDIYKSDLKVPRYTSYPTAPHFHSGITESTYSNWLASIPPNTATSLYLHIPFCKQLCWFCGCNTRVAKDYAPIERYMELIKKEMVILASKIKSPIIEHIHFGGGSPTIIRPDDFQGLMKYISQVFSLSPDAEIAIEIDPRTISEAKIAAYAKSGVNRTSIGVQDFNHKVQQSVNRIQPFTVVYDTVRMLRDYGIANINTDLIYGLPYQDVEGLVKTIEFTLMLKPERIALFGYAHVPWMKKNQQLIEESALPNIDMRVDMYHKAKKAFEDNGYMAIGLDHFVRNGGDLAIAQENRRLQRNFQGYTTDAAELLLGIGISSIGSMPQGYIQNISTPVEYAQSINAGNLPIAKGMPLTDEDHMRRNIISSLMCYLEVDLSKWEYDFSIELQLLEPLIQKNIVEVDNTVITIKEEGRAALRVVAATFDTYLNSADKKHSVAI